MNLIIVRVWEDNKMDQMVQNGAIKPPRKLLLFESPWAQNIKDEIFYEQTLTEIGQVKTSFLMQFFSSSVLSFQYIEGDLKLSHLYNMLIFATLPEGSILTENVPLMQLKVCTKECFITNYELIS